MRKLTRFGLILLIVGICLGTWIHLSRPAPIAVRLQPAEKGGVEEIVANTRAGTVNACRRARLAPSLGGQIAFLGFREGERVKTGELLLSLWNKDLIARVTLAEREAEAAEASSRAACLNADHAEREAARQIKLSRRKLASEEDVDRSITGSKAARADCEAAQATARVHHARVGVTQAELEKTHLIAPFDGIVAEVSGELNEYVTPSPPGIPTPPAVDLIDDSCYYISAPIDEVDASQVRVGATARVTLDAFGDRSFIGSVRRIAPYVLDLEKQARTVEVEVVIGEPPADATLLAGYSADVEIVVQHRDDVLRIPTSAVRQDDSVLVLDPDTSRIEEREIEIGLKNWDYTEVQAGITTGEQVVLSLDLEGVEPGVLAVPAREED